MIRDHRFRLHGVRVRSVPALFTAAFDLPCHDHSVSLNLSVFPRPITAGAPPGRAVPQPSTIKYCSTPREAWPLKASSVTA
eukprot:523337-Hanusia_phi.AAC.1